VEAKATRQPGRPSAGLRYGRPAAQQRPRAYRLRRLAAMWPAPAGRRPVRQCAPRCRPRALPAGRRDGIMLAQAGEHRSAVSVAVHQDSGQVRRVRAPGQRAGSAPRTARRRSLGVCAHWPSQQVGIRPGLPDVQKVGHKARQIARCRLGDLRPVVRQSAGTRAPRSSLARNAPRRMSTRPGAQGGVPGVRMCTGPDWAEPSVTRPLRTPQAEDAGALGRQTLRLSSRFTPT
jgi:hypothetical protein